MSLNWLGWESWFPLTLWSQLWDHGAMYLVKSNVRIAEVSWHVQCKLSQLGLASKLIPLYRKRPNVSRQAIFMCSCGLFFHTPTNASARMKKRSWRRAVTGISMVPSALNKDFGFAQEPPSRKSRWSGSQPLKLWSWGSLSSKHSSKA